MPAPAFALGLFPLSREHVLEGLARLPIERLVEYVDLAHAVQAERSEVVPQFSNGSIVTSWLNGEGG